MSSVVVDKGELHKFMGEPTRERKSMHADFCILESDVSGADQAEDPEGYINSCS